MVIQKKNSNLKMKLKERKICLVNFDPINYRQLISV